MNKESNVWNKANIPKILGVVLPSLPAFSLRFGLLYLRYKKKSQRAKKIFQNELIRQGIDREIAKYLTKEYQESSNIFSI